LLAALFWKLGKSAFPWIVLQITAYLKLRNSPGSEKVIFIVSIGYIAALAPEASIAKNRFDRERT
jgi:hypothetical protein